MPLAVSAPVDSLPEVDLLPVQLPVAVQELASAEDQVSNADPPLETDVGFAASDTVGRGGGKTEIVANALALPPAPVQVKL